MARAGKEEMKEWLEKLKESEAIIVVEGKRDIIALENLGIPKQRIFRLNDAVFACAEELAAREKEIIILTDFDAEGKKLYGSLSKDLASLGAKVDRYFREFLMKNTPLSHIEGIDTFFENLSSSKVL